MTLSVDLELIEETAKLLYIRALKILPDDIKLGFAKLTQSESDATAVNPGLRRMARSAYRRS